MRKIIVAVALAAVLLCVSASAMAQTSQMQDPVQGNIMQTAAEAGNFKTLAGAVDMAGLEDTLSTGGPYTVFAPTDDAFNNLPPGELDALMKDRTRLADVLKNHVVAGRYTIQDLARLGKVQTLGGKTLTITSSNSAFAINNAHIIKNDIPAGNGIIQAVDSVIIAK